MLLTERFSHLPPKQQGRVPYFALILAVFAAYASVWPNEFVFDDNQLIRGNEFLKHWGGIPDLLTSLNFAGSGIEKGFYRPVPMLLHFFVYWGFGPSTIAFHALNLALQALNACLLLYFGVRAGFGKGAAFAAALLWAVHPLYTEAVAYMAATPELLWSTFCLLGLITLLPDFTPRKICQAMIFFVLALGSKESAVVFPALATVTLFFVSKERGQFSSYLKTWPFWLLAAGFAFAWIIFMHKTNYTMFRAGTPMFFQEYAANITTRVLTCLATLPAYASMIVWPEGLHMARNFPVFSSLLNWMTATGALMAGLGLLQILWGRARQGLALSFGLLWFAIGQSPNTGIALPVDALVSEHWMYLPTMGLFLGVAQTAAGIFVKRQKAAQLLVLVIALSLGAATFFQNEKWRDQETLYQNILQNGGHFRQLSSQIGNTYLSQRKFDKALEQFRYVADHPEDYPDHPPAMWATLHMNMALAWLQVGLDKDASIAPDEMLPFLPSSPHIPEAIGEFGKAAMIDPDNYWPHKFLVVIYRYQGNTAMAEFHEKQADRILQRQAR